MVNLLILGVVAVACFIGGVLFGRRNTKKVEAALAEVKAAAEKAGVKL